MPKTQICIYLEADQAEKLRRLHEITRVPSSEFMRAAVAGILLRYRPYLDGSRPVSQFSFQEHFTVTDGHEALIAALTAIASGESEKVSILSRRWGVDPSFSSPWGMVTRLATRALQLSGEIP